MKGVAADGVDASVAAYKAGADILLMPLDARQTIANLDAEFESGSLDEAGLDMRVRKVLDLKSRCGMLDARYTPFIDTAQVRKLADRPMSEFIIQSICDRSITYVKGSRLTPFRFRNNVAYVAFNATSDDSQAFHKELLRYGTVPRFDLPADATPAQIDSVGKLLKKYKKVIVGIHSGRPVPSSGGAKRFAKITSQQLERIGRWAEKHRLYGCYMGNPYDLDKLPEHKMFDAFCICYSDNLFNNKSAARSIAVGGAAGVLPVAAGGYPCGYRD